MYSLIKHPNLINGLLYPLITFMTFHIFFLGSKINDYLLEKSRIVTHAPEERNFHVFYELLAGLTDEQKAKYGLMTAEKYFYLNQGGSCVIDGKMDAEDYQNLVSAMQVKEMGLVSWRNKKIWMAFE